MLLSLGNHVFRRTIQTNRVSDFKASDAKTAASLACNFLKSTEPQAHQLPQLIKLGHARLRSAKCKVQAASDTCRARCGILAAKRLGGDGVGVGVVLWQLTLAKGCFAGPDNEECA